ncbi:MAG: phenylalanine 4-monooxygenase [Hyphomicrobiaceae bacterium]
MTPSKARCLAARPAPDYTIGQDWPAYTVDEHARWDRLFARSWAALQGRACEQYAESAARLKLSQSGIPDMAELSERLDDISGWRVVPVAGLVPDDVFFEHLANRRFPAGAFIRSETEMDYLEEPDIFHDIFGHVPLLANSAYAEFMQAYGVGGRRALELGRLDNLARLYWYTIEFGLVRSSRGLRIFGAGIMSSTAETVFSLDDPSPNRIAFDLERVMRTRYVIDDFQQTYFVIDSLDVLRDACAVDFGPLYHRLASSPDIEAHRLLAGDAVISRGSLAYFHGKAHAVVETGFELHGR